MKLLQTLKDKLPKKLFTKKTLIIAVVVIAIGGFAAYKLLGKKDVPVFIPVTRTTVLNKTSLVNSISVNGTVKSIDVVNITTTLPYKVTDILVQVGDRVKKGDIIAKLDTTDIQKSISEERKKLSEAKSTAQDALNKAIAKKDEAQASLDGAAAVWERSKAALTAAYAPYSVATTSTSVAQRDYDSAFAKEQALGVAMNNAYGAKVNADLAKANADTAHAAALSAYNAAKANSDATPGDAALQAITDAAQVVLTNATTAKTNADAAQPVAAAAHTTAKADYDAQVVVTATAKTALDNAQKASNFEALKAAYTAADLVEETSRKAYESTAKLRDAEIEAYKSAQKAFDNAGTSTTLEDDIKKLEECTIKAETNGVITSINAVVGSAMGQSANAGTGPLAVIQDTDNLVISTSFKEYDIPNIAIGQKVTIKSDATGDEVITGHVSQISMTAASGQSGDVSFPAEIRVETSGTGLLIGMNAKASVILSQKDNIFVVPDDAIGMNEKGEQVVYLQNGENYDPIVVTTGVSNDFYTEIISSQLTEGAVIRSNASEAGSMMMNGGTAIGGGSVSIGGSSGGAIMIG